MQWNAIIAVNHLINALPILSLQPVYDQRWAHGENRQDLKPKDWWALLIWHLGSLQRSSMCFYFWVFCLTPCWSWPRCTRTLNPSKPGPEKSWMILEDWWALWVCRWFAKNNKHLCNVTGQATYRKVMAKTEETGLCKQALWNDKICNLAHVLPKITKRFKMVDRSLERFFPSDLQKNAQVRALADFMRLIARLVFAAGLGFGWEGKTLQTGKGHGFFFFPLPICPSFVLFWSEEWWPIGEIHNWPWKS